MTLVEEPAYPEPAPEPTAEQEAEQEAQFDPNAGKVKTTPQQFVAQLCVRNQFSVEQVAAYAEGMGIAGPEARGWKAFDDLPDSFCDLVLRAQDGFVSGMKSVL